MRTGIVAGIELGGLRMEDRSLPFRIFTRDSLSSILYPRSSILVSIDRVAAHREFRRLAGARAFRLSSRQSPALGPRRK